MNKLLSEVILSRESVTGYEIEMKVKQSLKQLGQEGVIARQLHSTYFIEGTQNFKPVKFGYYKIIRRKDAITLKRDFNLSPSAKDYFNIELVDLDMLRCVIINKKSVLGKELKDMISEMVGCEYCSPSPGLNPEQVSRIQRFNFTIQLAKYMNQYFVSCEKPIKDEVYYTIDCKEYGTATVYRDLKVSPRTIVM